MSSGLDPALGAVPRRAALQWCLDAVLVVAAFVVDGLVPALNPGLDLSAPSLAMLVVVALASLALAWRRRVPLLVLLVWCLVGLAPLVLPTREPFAGLLIMVTTVAGRLPRRVALGSLLVAAVPLAIGGYGSARRQPAAMNDATTVLLVGIWVAFGVAAFGVGRVIRLLRDREVLLRRLHAAELSASIREERLRLARDLHDIVAHSVSAMILQAAGARSLRDDTDVRIRTSLRSIEVTGADAMKELHRLLGLLRTPSDDPPPLTAQPGLGDVDQVLATTRACGVQVELRETGHRRPLDPEVSYTAFRMVQECMANVIKHGGAGTRSTVEIRWHEDGVDIIVRNDEHDAVTAGMLSGGYGLKGLTERVEQVGGRFDAGPQAESVFVASASLPLRPKAVAGEG